MGKREYGKPNNKRTWLDSVQTKEPPGLKGSDAICSLALLILHDRYYLIKC